MARRKKGNGTVYWDAKREQWVARFNNPLGKPTYGYFKKRDGCTKEDAEKWLINQKADMVNGDYIIDDDITFGQWMLIWLKSYKSNDKESTTDNYVCRLKRFECLYDVKLKDIKPITLQHIFNNIDNAPSTLHVTRTIIRGMFKKAVDLELIKKNPAKAIELPPLVKTPMEIFTPEELQTIFTKLKDLQFRTIIALLANTGMRLGELCSLKWNALNGSKLTIQYTLYARNKKRITTSTKSVNSTRVIELDEFTLNLLNEHRRKMKLFNIEGYMFLTKIGTQYTQTALRKRWEYQEAKLGFKKHRHPHCFRHTHVSMLLNHGYSVVDVAARIGDKPKTVLDTYAHIMPNRDKEMAKTIAKMYK